MYILFEDSTAVIIYDCKEFYNMDCMGYCDTEEQAIAWVEKNRKKNHIGELPPHWVE